MINYYEAILEEKSKAEKYLLPSSNNNFRFYYRGHRNLDWPLLPTIARPENSHKNEMEEIKRAINDGLWSFDDSLFENIARLQHYGYATRFLDYTTEFDIALYFACQEETDKFNCKKDGIVSICRYTNDRDATTLDTALISELAFIQNQTPLTNFATSFLIKHKKLVEKWDDKLSILNKRRISTDIDDIATDVLSWIEHGFMVTPTQEDLKKMEEKNSRIVRQKGAFFVFGNRVTPSSTRASTQMARLTKIIPELSKLPITIRPDLFQRGSTNLLIPEKWKQDILTALAQKGITKEYLFPDRED